MDNLSDIIAEHDAYNGTSGTWCMVCANTRFPCQTYRLATRALGAEAAVTAVEREVEQWEDEIDEHTRAKKFGIAEGLRIAMQSVRTVLGSGRDRSQ